MIRTLRPMLVLGAGVTMVSVAHAGGKNQPAPELQVDKWVHLPKGRKEGPKLHGDWKGKVAFEGFHLKVEEGKSLIGKLK